MVIGELITVMNDDAVDTKVWFIISIRQFNNTRYIESEERVYDGMNNCWAEKSASEIFVRVKVEFGDTYCNSQEKYVNEGAEIKASSQSDTDASAWMKTFWSRKITRLDGQMVSASAIASVCSSGIWMMLGY